MTFLVVGVFILAYVGMALGRLPGLALDRAGIAIVAAILVVAIGAVPEGRVAAAIHFPTLILLFALMILSARFAAAGFYDAAAWIAAAAGSPTRLLALTVAVGGLLSAVLVNDVVVFVMTPLLVRGLAARGLDPRPFLAAPESGIVRVSNNLPAPAFDRRQTLKAVAATLVLLLLFATPIPREIAALAVAGVLLTSRRYATRDMLASVDWPLLLLITGLFVINAALADTGLPTDLLAWAATKGWLPDRLAIMAPGALALSNTIGNVPAVVMLLGVWPQMPSGMLVALALTSTLAGNFLLVGSIANLIVAERAASAGARFGFRDHARAGIAMTLASLALAAAWLVGGGWIGW